MLVRRTLAIVLCLLCIFGSLVATPLPSAAASDEQAFYDAAALLGQYRLILGDERGFRFRDEITRAEMAKLLVLSLGMESQVSQFVGRQDFWDTGGHWAEAYIALARRLGILNGYPEGDFRPQNPVSYAEVITALARLVGLEPSSDPWPRTYVAPAKAAGIISDGAKAADWLYGAAVRGDVFVMLKRTVVDVKNYAGMNLLQRYLDHTPPVLVLDPQPDKTQSASLTVTGTAGDAVRLQINGVTVPLQNGYYEHEVSLRLGPNTIRVQAFDVAGNMAEATAHVERLAGNAATIEFTGPASVVVGKSALYRVVLRDRYGEVVTDQSQVEAEVTGGIGTFDVKSATLTPSNKPGKGSITLWAGAARASLDVTVTAGGLERLAITPDPVALAPDETTTFVVIGYDAAGNAIALSDIAWSASGGSIDQNGRFKAPSTPMTVTVTATAGGRSATVTVNPINYQAGSVQIAPPTATIRANGKSELTLTATVLNTGGKPMTDYRGTLTISSSAPGTLVPLQPSVTVTDGMARILLRAGATPGSATVTASTNLGKQGSVTVTVNPQLIQSVQIAGRQVPSTDGNSQGVIEVTALDQDGNPMLTALPQAVFVSLTATADSAATPAPTLTFLSNGQSKADVVLKDVDPATGDVRASTTAQYSPGTATFYINGTIKPDALSYVRVLPGALKAAPVGAPAQVKIESIPYTIAGQTRSIYVNIVDSSGFRVTQAALLTGLSVQLRDQTGATWLSTTSAVAGQGRLQFDVMQTKAMTYTYTAYLYPGGHTATQSADVVAGPVAAVSLKATPAAVQADNSSKSTLQAELRDSYGNRVTTGSYPVTFSQVAPFTGAMQALADQTVNSVGGLAEVKVVAARVVASQSYQASVPNPAGPAFTGTVGVTTQGAPDHLALIYGDNDGDGVEGGAGDNTGTAGIPLTLMVEVRDNLNNLVSYESGRQITLTLRNMTTFAEASYTATTTDGKAIFRVTRSEASQFAIKAESATLMKALTVGYGGALADAVLQPSQTAGVRIVRDIDLLHTDSGKSYALLSVQILDRNGNVTTNQAGLPLTVTLRSDRSAFDYGFFTIDDSLTGVKTATRTVVIPQGASVSLDVKLFSGATAGTVTISATTPDGTSASATVTSAALGSVASLRVEPIQPVTLEPYTYADSAVTGQTVTVTALDANGRRVTQYGSGGEQITLTASDDARVVAVYDPAIRTWRSLDTSANNGLGDFGATYAAVADRGRAVFRVRANSVGTKVYTLGYNGNAAARQEMGRFEGDGPDSLTVQVAERTITGGGDQVAILARVRDRFGNVLSSATGKVQFALSTTAGGALLATSADLQNGIATVFFQSDLKVSGDVSVTVSAWASGLKRADGSALTVGGSLAQAATDTVTVDGTPDVTALTMTNGATSGTVESGDAIIFTFSEPIDGTTLLSGLTSTTPVTTGLGAYAVKFDAALATISFTGLPGLGAIHLASGSIVGDQSYSIAQVALDATSTMLTITLGSKTGAGADAKVGATGSASLVMNGSLRDPVGSGAFGPFTLVPTGGL